MGIMSQAMCKHEDLEEVGKYRKLKCTACGKILWLKDDDKKG